MIFHNKLCHKITTESYTSIWPENVEKQLPGRRSFQSLSFHFLHFPVIRTRGIWWRKRSRVLGSLLLHVLSYIWMKFEERSTCHCVVDDAFVPQKRSEHRTDAVRHRRRHRLVGNFRRFRFWRYAAVWLAAARGLFFRRRRRGSLSLRSEVSASILSRGFLKARRSKFTQ